MGQYHKVVSITDEAILVDDTGGFAGIKLKEFGYASYSLINGLILKLAKEGKDGWKGHNVAVIGDYYEDGDLPAEDAYLTELGEDSNFYVYARNNYTTRGVLEILLEQPHISRDPHAKAKEYQLKIDEAVIAEDTSDYRIINLDKKQQLTPTLLGHANNSLAGMGAANTTPWNAPIVKYGASTALTALLAVSNGRGGGDFTSEDPLIGSWGGDRIAVVETTDPLYTEVKDWTDISEQFAYDTLNEKQYDYR